MKCDKSIHEGIIHFTSNFQNKMEGLKTDIDNGLIEEQFNNICFSYPDKIALLKDGLSVTYDEVRKRSNDIAGVLFGFIQCHGLRKYTGNGCIIATFMSPSFDRIATNLAILQLGAACLPLDPILPLNRLKSILREAKPMCIISSSDYFERLNDQSVHSEGVRIIEMNEIDTQLEGRKGAICWKGISRLTDEENPLAYVMYTSGKVTI